MTSKCICNRNVANTHLDELGQPQLHHPCLLEQQVCTSPLCFYYFLCESGLVQACLCNGDNRCPWVTVGRFHGTSHGLFNMVQWDSAQIASGTTLPYVMRVRGKTFCYPHNLAIDLPMIRTAVLQRAWQTPSIDHCWTTSAF